MNAAEDHWLACTKKDNSINKHVVSKKRASLVSAIATLDSIVCMDDVTFDFFMNGLFKQLIYRREQRHMRKEREAFEAFRSLKDELEQALDDLTRLKARIARQVGTIKKKKNR